jgi:hypothetical protein
MDNRKGQGELNEYVITFLIGILVMAVIYSLVISVYNNQIKREIYDELNQLELQTSNSIIKLYNAGYSYSENIDNNTAVLLGSLDLKYPIKVARRSYEIMLVSSNLLYSTLNVSENITNMGQQSYSGPKIVGRSVETPTVEVIVNVPNIDAVLQGSIFNGLNSILSLYKANINGTIKNMITLGNVSLFASITGIE